jgi:hypothetical protein
VAYTIFGGRLAPPIDLTIHGRIPVAHEDIRRNVRHAAGLGLKTYRDVAPHPSRRLAVVGGGPSIEQHALALRTFDGEIWAINGAYGWCRERGIEATLFALDPHPIVAKWAKGAHKALVDVVCDPSVFETLKDADVTVFDCGADDGQICARGATATAAPHLACRMGYHEVTFYGCECSYPAGGSHAYMHEERDEQLLVACNGEEFLTGTDFYIYAIELARFIRELPGFLKEESGGLLRAMVASPEFHIRWVSEALANGISRVGQDEAA